jgi:hypothetical protein
MTGRLPIWTVASVSRLRLLTHPVHTITVRFYRPTLQSVTDRLAGRASGIRELYLSTFPDLCCQPNDRSSWAHEVVPAWGVARQR